MKEYFCPDNINKKDVQHIDGMDSLLGYISIEKFVKLAIESSFFFSPSIVRERQEVMIDLLKRKESLPARNTARKKETASNVFRSEDNNFICKIHHDAFGNDVVIKLINQYTGYTIARAKSIFRNFVISHIWGEAKDPRYFTSFWNLVLIPAWANHLMDKKDAPQGSVASILHSTIKKICFQVYHVNELNWNEMGGKVLPQDATSDVIPGLYTINFLEKKDANNIIGNRTRQEIIIKPNDV